MPMPRTEALTDSLPHAGADGRALMSALADGDDSALERGCSLWRDDAAARSAWHAYHLIGDVLRSDDLASQVRRDADFLATLRSRLAQEPVPLAPTVAAATARMRWRLPVAAAAGVAAVAGVLALTQTLPVDNRGGTVAFGPRPNSAVTLAGGKGGGATTMVIEGRMVRDPQIDAYLRAHRQMAGGAVTPGGVPRSIETLAPLAQPGR